MTDFPMIELASLVRVSGGKLTETPQKPRPTQPAPLPAPPVQPMPWVCWTDRKGVRRCAL